MVIPVSSVNGSLNVGHVLLGNSSSGFLETVNKVVQEETGKFVYTELSVCFRNFSNFKTYVYKKMLLIFNSVKLGYSQDPITVFKRFTASVFYVKGFRLPINK